MIDPKTDTLWKTYLVYFLVLIFGIAIIAKIIVVQTKDNKELVKLAEQREYMSTLWKLRVATSFLQTGN